MLAYIHELIDKNQGSISVSDFMNAALYHEKYGYYMNKSPIGKDGDFITAPEISQLFGEVIAIWVMCTWERLGKPLKFSLVELGPGKGTLIHDIMRVTKKYNSFFNSMAVHLVEISPALQKIQKERLRGLNINWHKNIDNLPKQPTIFLANEFFDALPIDQFIYHDKKWCEIRVIKLDNGMLFQCLALKKPRERDDVISKPLSCCLNTPFLSSQCLNVMTSALYTQLYEYHDIEVTFTKKNVIYDVQQSLENLTVKTTDEKLFNGAVIEVSSIGIEILKKLEEKIYNDRGAALIIDYGYVYPLYKSTLQSVKQHRYTNFLEDVGNCDITALVNFQALRNSLKYLDCKILTQREYLYLFGIRERMQSLMKNVNSEQKSKLFGEYLRLTESMGTLFKVMLINYL